MIERAVVQGRHCRSGERGCALGSLYRRMPWTAVADTPSQASEPMSAVRPSIAELILI